MAKIFLVRHAESLANAQGIYQGQTFDTPLSSLGALQAQALGARFASQPFAQLITSPLTRTLQTAHTLARHQATPPPLVVEQQIIETNHGQWEGLAKYEIQTRWPEIYETWLHHPSKAAFPGGEVFPQTIARAIAWYESVADNKSDLVVITHTNIIQALLVYTLGLTPDDIWQFPIGPTSVTLIDTHAADPVIYANDSSHLVGLESDLSLHAL